MTNMPIEYIIELGLIRKRNVCAKCGNKMDIENYNIQLCELCRVVELKKYAEEGIKEGLNDNGK